MDWKDLPYLAFAAFAAILFRLCSRGGDQARSTEESASGNDGTAGGASSTHTSTEGQEVANSSGYDYEVFLSFRGPDTRASFADFLYTSLKGAGIRTFRDDEDLREGVEFAPELLQVIKQSKILIPIFSKDYASSVWCLKEVAQMVECKKNGGKKIMPIFYDVAPSEVRYQIGNYEKSFLLHERKKRYDQKTIREWKDALRAVGEINGWVLPRGPTRREGESVRTITWKVFNELKKASLVVSNYLVGVDHPVDEIMEMIDAWTSETRIIGITGMGGIGKTTIAKIIYNKLLEKFDNCCFLSNIREMSEKGIECLQNQLISDILKEKWTNIRNSDEGTQTIRGMLCEKKVLLLLDDVDKKEHMDALVGSRDWFGKGSKLIITTRNKQVLVHKVDKIYEVNILDTDQSLQLFSKHAFRRDYPLKDDINQSMRAIKIAGGLPLALEVMGSFLSCTGRKKWNSELAKLESVPHKDVQSKLKISYDVLANEEKHIFLDIACLLIGYDKDIIVHFWKSKFYPENAMDVLESMSLIKIKEDNKVWMHDQLRDLGRRIVQQTNIKKKTRVWNAEEALELLERQENKKKLEALRLDLNHQHRFTYEDFKRLPNLRFLEVCRSKETFCAEERLFWHESTSSVLPTNVFQENSDLLQQLRWLAWHDIPPTFKITNFSMEDVVILDLSESKITHDWKGWSHMKVMNNLKVMKLTNCIFLDRTPDFLAHSKLERLILQGCYKLVKIDKSICQLKSLVFLDLSHCGNLRRLPDEMGRDLENLKYLYMIGCNSLERLPNTIGNLKSLNKLNIPKSGIKELPDSIGNLKLLIELDISKSEIKELPDSIGSLESLIKLDISSTAIKELPDSIGNLESLIELDISQSEIEELPDSIGNLKSLNKLNISESEIKELPDFIGNLELLIELDISRTGIEELPDSIGNLKSLDMLNLTGVGIKKLPDSIGNLESLIWLYLSESYIEKLPDSIGQLKKLKVVDLTASNISKIPDALWTIETLEVFGAMFLCRFNGEIGNCIYRNRSLKILILEHGKIYAVPRLPGSLIELGLFDLYMDTFPDLSNLTNLKELHLQFVRRDSDGESEGPVEEDPMQLRIGSLHGESDGEFDGAVEKDLPRWIGNLSKLESLILKSPYVTALPTDISLLPRLKLLKLFCPNLRCLSSLPSSLSHLDLESECVAALPTDMSLLPQLEILELTCPNLRCLSSLPSSLRYLALQKYKSGGSMEGEDLSNLKTLSTLFIGRCAISEIRGLDRLENREQLRLEIFDCGNLVEIQGGLPPSLYELKIEGCGSLQKLPDLSSLKELGEVYIRGCCKLNVEAISSFCSEKGVKFK